MQLEEKCEMLCDDRDVFKKSMKRRERREESDNNSYETYQQGYSQPYFPRDENQVNQIEGFHNFLADGAKVAVNQPLGQNGRVEIMMGDLSQYSSILVIAECEDQVSHIIMPIQKANKV